MNTFMEDRIEQFKKRINFEEISKAQLSEQWIVTSWESPLQWQFFKEQNWEVVNNSDALIVEKDFVLKKWVLRKKGKGPVIQVGVSSANAELAQQHLLEVAANTSTMEIPYKRGPVELGQISIINSGKAIHMVAWVFHNIYLMISDLDQTIDVLSLAQWLQSSIRSCTVNQLSGHKPKIKNLKISAQNIQINETLNIEVEFPPEVRTEAMYIKIKKQGTSINLIREKGTIMTFLGEKPGVTIMNIIIVDRVTLLSQSTELQFAVS